MSDGIGRAIRDARIKAGLTMRKLADKVGVSVPFQCDLEHDRRGTSRLADYAEALGVTEGSLFGAAKVITRHDLEWINANPGLVALLRRHRRRSHEDKLDKGKIR